MNIFVLKHTKVRKTTLSNKKKRDLIETSSAGGISRPQRQNKFGIHGVIHYLCRWSLPVSA